jgi:hypothetical protein
MSPREIFLVLVALAVAIALARWISSRRGRPKRVRYDDPLQQIDADFPPEHREEAREIVGSIAAHAREEDRPIVWRRTVDAARGDIAKLRRSAPKAIAALDRIYKLLGDGDRSSTD